MFRFSKRDNDGARLSNDYTKWYLKGLLRYAKCIGLVHFVYNSRGNMLLTTETIPIWRAYHICFMIIIILWITVCFASILLCLNNSFFSTNEYKMLHFLMDVVERCCTYLATLLLCGLLVKKWRYCINASNRLLKIRRQCRFITRRDAVVRSELNCLIMSRWLLIIVTLHTGYGEQKLRIFLQVIHALIKEVVYQGFLFYALNLQQQQYELNYAFRLGQTPADLRQLMDLFMCLDKELKSLIVVMRPFLYALYLQLVAYFISGYEFLKCAVPTTQIMEILLYIRFMARIISIMDIMIIAIIAKRFKWIYGDFRAQLYVLLRRPWQKDSRKKFKGLLLKLTSMLTFYNPNYETIDSFHFQLLESSCLKKVLFQLIFVVIIALRFYRAQRKDTDSSLDCKYKTYAFVNETVGNMQIYNSTYGTVTENSYTMWKS